MRSATKKRIGKDKDYLAWLHTLPCVCCERAFSEGITQLWKTEAAHIGDRGVSEKCPDREAIPLCVSHHRLGYDSHHRLQKYFWTHWGIDKDKLITELQKRYEESR